MKSTTKGLLSLIFQGGIATLLFTALIVGTNIAYFYEPEINTVLAPPIVDKTSLKQTTVEGQKMSARIMEEGSVLLQNKDNVLPLSMEETPKVNVFGWHSIDWIYGTGGDQVGSGGVLPEDDDFDKNIDLYRALNNYNISYNKDLYDMYYRYFKPFNLGRSLKNGSIKDAQKLVEPDIDDKNYYSDDLLNEAKAYSDTAIMVISRLCGEGGGNPSYQPKNGPTGESKDESRHYLEISNEEEKLLTYLGKNFDKVVVLINNCNQMELGKIETIEGVDACMYVGYTGTRGAVSIPKLLYGEASPSGRLVDTFVMIYTPILLRFITSLFGEIAKEAKRVIWTKSPVSISVISGMKPLTRWAFGVLKTATKKDTRESCNILLDMVYLTQFSIGRSMASKWMDKPTQKTPQSKKTPKSILP